MTADAWGVVVVTLLAQAIVIADALVVITDARLLVLAVSILVELDALADVQDAIADVQIALGALDVEDRARQIAQQQVKDRHAHHAMAVLGVLVRVHLVVDVVDAI